MLKIRNMNLLIIDDDEWVGVSLQLNQRFWH